MEEKYKGVTVRRILEDYKIFNEDLEYVLKDFIEQEIEKARQNGIMTGLNASKTEIENLQRRLAKEELSKLTTR